MTDETDEDIFDVIPHVLPHDMYHDGWAGAAGAEIRDEVYEPFPHEWDQNLFWCRIRYAGYYKNWDMDRPVEKIPGWIIRRALAAVRYSDELRRY